MKLIKFRVKNYRSIEDSGDIPVDEKITTFVGINESGKTNVLRALRKLNSKTDREFNELTEQPVWLFRNFNPQEVFVTAVFSLSEKEQKEIQSIDSNCKITEVSFSKRKNMETICDFNNIEQTAISFSTFFGPYIKQIHTIIQSIDVSSIENGDNKKSELISKLNGIQNKFNNITNVMKNKTLDKINESLQNFKNQVESIEPQCVTSINNILDEIKQEVHPDNNGQIKNYLLEHLPVFIYFENIGIIDSRIDLRSLVDHMTSNNMNEEEQTAKTLLDLSGLNPKNLLELSKEEGLDKLDIMKNKDTLSQLCNLASLSLSKELDDIWYQNDHDVQIEVNSSFLRLWVTNKQDQMKLQLEERSRGYQWYFSFYVVFSAESEGQHKDSILLLDEPALFLHALGQKDFLTKALPELSKRNQIIYTTHSPFLLDLSKPHSIHTVTLNKDDSRRNTVVSKDHWANDKDALFPLQSAIGYHLVQSLFIGPKNLVVEGLIDFWFLDGMSNLFKSNEKQGLNDSFVITPAGSGTKSVLISKVLVSQDLKVGVLLDSDNEGDNAKSQLLEDKILRVNQICRIGDIFDSEKKVFTIEDVFTEEFYLRYVTKRYSSIPTNDFVLESNDRGIVKRIESYFAKNKLGRFDKSLIALDIVRDFSKQNYESLPKDIITNFEMLFSVLNDLMEKSPDDK